MASVEEFLSDPSFQLPEPILVPVPGSSLVFTCKTPDLLPMVFSGFVDWPALRRVRELNEASEPPVEGGTAYDNRPLPTIAERADAAGAMLDEWVCAAVISPRVVFYEHEAGPNAMWVGRIPFPIRQAIYNRTFKVTRTAGADFRSQESASAPPGQGGEAVRTEAIVDAGDDGSAGSAGPGPSAG